MKNKIITISFLLVLFSLFFANLILPDKELSHSERRRLAQLPKFEVDKILSGETANAFNKYSTDQFAWREPFRAIKTFTDRNILLKKDTNRLFWAQGGIFNIEYPLKQDKVESMCQKLTTLTNTYFDGMDLYYSVVPDKNYFLPKEGGYLVMNYGQMVDIMRQNMPARAEYIDVFDVLNLENYYRSDGHWRQETLKPVIDRLNSVMGVPGQFDPANYEQRSYSPFYGAYYGQLAGMAPPDTMIWLENHVTKDAVVTSIVRPEHERLPIYYERGLGGMDSYELYLHGSQPLMFLENPHNTSGRELILVRDSYGSSLAPMLLESYSKIIVVDLRYITQQLLGDYIEFNGQDVLFMFSSTIINNSDTIRGE